MLDTCIVNRSKTLANLRANHLSNSKNLFDLDDSIKVIDDLNRLVSC